MNSDSSSSRPLPRGSIDSVRRQVVDVASEVMRGTSCASGGGMGVAADSSDQSAMSLYLALLMDRLPVYARTMITLHSHVGEGSVEENLVPVARATIQFYSEILAAKLGVFTKPEQLVRLRRVLKAQGVGPQVAHEKVTAYLEEEHRLGRVRADVDCEACAHLLVGACLNYAFSAMLLDEVTPRDAFAEKAVRGLRLTA
jgi:AefR-like transcriptional repressor, C-terminal domain